MMRISLCNVIPAKAGIQNEIKQVPTLMPTFLEQGMQLEKERHGRVDSRFRGNDRDKGHTCNKVGAC